MNHILERLTAKKRRLAIGLMSGTSLDGMDAALVEIEGAGLSISVKLLDFLTLPYNDETHSILMKAVMGEEGGSRLICCLNFLMGHIAAEACLELCRKAGVKPAMVDFVGSHGQTVFHQNEAVSFAGRPIRGTLQIGEASVIAEKIGCPVVSDFRVSDMAAGGQGAPLVPYTEYLLYRNKNKPLALQNIGGIGNITLLPAGRGAADIVAFDTGPGIMVIDAIARSLLGTPWDDEGRNAAAGKVNAGLLEWMLAFDRDYLEKRPPKSTGRERYNDGFVSTLLNRAQEVSLATNDILATVTRYTAETISLGIKKFCKPSPEELYVSGGGLHNKTLMAAIRELLPGCAVRSGDELGIPADAKEAVAFAILANETIFGLCNNAPAATGASHPVVMGKISF
jgi:anhydro-N-acetylmuramic acid kinase